VVQVIHACGKNVIHGKKVSVIIIGGACKAGCSCNEDCCDEYCYNKYYQYTPDASGTCDEIPDDACLFSENENCKCYIPHQGKCNEIETCCNGLCIDLSTDPNNCGECGRVCPEGQICVNGDCQRPCSDDADASHPDEKNYFQKGTCTDGTGSYTDTCSGNTLTEWYCSGGSCVSTTYDCTDNIDCTNGPIYCSISADGTTLYKKTDDWICHATYMRCEVFGKFTCNSWTCDASKAGTTQSCGGTTYYCCEVDGSYQWQTSSCSVNHPPSVTLISPADDSVVSASPGDKIPLTFRVDDPEGDTIREYTIYFDGSIGSEMGAWPSGSEITNNEFDISSSDCGSVMEWKVKAKDKYGYGDWSETWQFTVNCIPSVTLVSPEDGATISENEVNLKVTVDDDDGDTLLVTWYGKEMEGEWEPLNQDNLEPGTTAGYMWSNLYWGATYYWKVEACDNYVCVNSSSRMFQVELDSTSPSVSVTGAPSDWSNSDATADVSCSDTQSGCDESSYRLKTFSSNPGSCPEYYSQYTLTPPQTISSHVWVCGAAKDNVNNNGSSTPVEFKIDKTAPYISSINPESSDWTNQDGNTSSMHLLMR